MKALPVIVGVLTFAMVGGAIFVQSQKPAFVGVGSNSVNIQQVPRHPVTKQMLVNAEDFVGQEVPSFELPDSEGKSVKSTELIGQKPSVLVMTKDGCPCSIESQGFWTNLAMYYGNSVQFFGIIDVKSAGGKKFKTDFKVPYPILSSETDEVFRKFGAKQSVYVYVFDAKGIVQKVWPGYNLSSLKELNKLLSEMSGKEALATDWDMAPEKMTSGCFFFKPVGTEKPAW
ncbi:MAG: peroxiredoxin family protein [Fimbriimonadaceae bacterium]